MPVHVSSQMFIRRLLTAYYIPGKVVGVSLPIQTKTDSSIKTPSKSHGIHRILFSPDVILLLFPNLLNLFGGLETHLTVSNS